MINLTKDSRSIDLSKGGKITVVLSWPAATDYDAGAEILYKDGTTESIATFGAGGTAPLFVSRNRTVTHHGDLGRGEGVAQEVITILPDPEIEEIRPWAYSAQSNGTGSFYRYSVTTEVRTDDDSVIIKAEDASNDDRIYTLVPAILDFRGDSVKLSYLELYSDAHSELRPAFRKNWRGSIGFTLSGPKNNYK